MIAIDTQLLVFAHRRDAIWHERARDCIAQLAASGARWAIPLHCIVEFYATATRRYGSSPAEAIEQVDTWLESPSLAVICEDGQTWSTLRELLRAAQVVGPVAHDARIAAVCLQHGVTELWTQDRDFLRFPALRVRNPLIDLQPTGARELRTPWPSRATLARAARPRRPARGAARRR
ncbi:MAG: type II toxin-antitoxin system VapC family toxin [Acidobacteriota bacterium]